MTDKASVEQQIELREPIAVISLLAVAVTAVLKGFEAPVWIWIAPATWILLCVTIVFGQSEPRWRKEISNVLRSDRFTQVYTYIATGILDWIWLRFCKTPNPNARFLGTIRATMTWQLYDRTMLIAWGYPVLLLIFIWVFSGQAGRFGSAVVLPAAPFWPDGLVAAAAIVFVFVSLPARSAAAASKKPMAKIFFHSIPYLCIALAFIFFGFVKEPIIAGAIAGAIGMVLTIYRAGSASGIAAIALSTLIASLMMFLFENQNLSLNYMVLAITALAAFAVSRVDTTHRPVLSRAILTLTVLITWPIVLIYAPWPMIPESGRGFFLFIGVLPLINGAFDVASYAITLALMRLGLNAKQPFFFGVLDFVVAFFLFLALGSTLTLVVSSMNVVSGVQIFDIGALFAGIYTDPNSYWWLYLMVFSTVLPTALHGLISILGIQALVPHLLRNSAASLLDNAPYSIAKASLAPILIGSLLLFPIVLVGAVFWFLWLLSGGIIVDFGWAYFSMLREFAQGISAF